MVAVFYRLYELSLLERPKCFFILSVYCLKKRFDADVLIKATSLGSLEDSKIFLLFKKNFSNLGEPKFPREEALHLGGA